MLVIIMVGVTATIIIMVTIMRPTTRTATTATCIESRGELPEGGQIAPAILRMQPRAPIADAIAIV